MPFSRSELAELAAYLKPGRSFFVPNHLLSGLFGADVADLASDAKCRAWARAHHCRIKAHPEAKEVEFVRLPVGDTSASWLGLAAGGTDLAIP